MSGDVLVLVEHRRGEIRDITYEMLGAAAGLASGRGGKVRALLLGKDVDGLASQVVSRADVVEVVEHDALAEYNSDSYQKALVPLIKELDPSVVLIGNTSYGLDLAPGLATALGLPLITDVISLTLEPDSLVAVRPIYGGKANARMRARGTSSIVTVESGAFAADPASAKQGEVVHRNVSLPGDLNRRRFVDFVESPASDIDITQSDVVVSVGRGIGDPENIPVVEQLAEALGGVLACSRPVVDKKWLPKARQVGISGKTIAPKLYLAVGVSGAFQHLAGIKKAQTVVAINKDPNAPIFRVADYGVVADLFAVVPKLTERIEGMKKGR